MKQSGNHPPQAPEEYNDKYYKQIIITLHILICSIALIIHILDNIQILDIR